VSAGRGAAATALRVACLLALLLLPRAVDDWQVILQGVLAPEQATLSLILVLGLLTWAWARVGPELDRLARRWRLVAMPAYCCGLLVLLIAAQILVGPVGEGLLFLCGVASAMVGTARHLAAYLVTGMLVARWRALGQVVFLCSLATGLLWRSALVGGVQWYLLGLDRAGGLIPVVTVLAAALAVLGGSWAPRQSRPRAADVEVAPYGSL